MFGNAAGSRPSSARCAETFAQFAANILGKRLTVIQPSAIRATRRSARSMIAGVSPTGRGFEAIQIGQGRWRGRGMTVVLDRAEAPLVAHAILAPELAADLDVLGE